MGTSAFDDRLWFFGVVSLRLLCLHSPFFYHQQSTNTCRALRECIVLYAAGEILPVYVAYKAENIYNGWMVGGPEKARYSCSKSGWFDGNTFEDWFKTIFFYQWQEEKRKQP